MTQIRVFDLPCEIVFMILKYTDNNTLRKMKKIPELSLYKQEIDRLIQKELKNQIDYRNYYMNKFITDCFTKQLAKDERDFNRFGRMRWSSNQLDVYKTVKKYTNSAIKLCGDRNVHIRILWNNFIELLGENPFWVIYDKVPRTECSGEKNRCNFPGISHRFDTVIINTF